MASHEPQKTLEIAIKNAHFQRVALSPQNWLGLGSTWRRAAPKGAQLGPSGGVEAQVGATGSCWAEVGPKAIQMDSKLKPSDAHENSSHVYNMPQLGTFWQQLRAKLGPAETQHGEHIGTLRQTKRHR